MTAYTIDASDKALGRVASQAAAYLRGKSLPTFERNQVPETKVKIINAARMRLSARQLTDKTYVRYTGYPGGLKFIPLGAMAARRGYGEIFRLAIKRMLPANKLRARILKNLTIEN